MRIGPGWNQTVRPLTAAAAPTKPKVHAASSYAMTTRLPSASSAA